MSGGSGQMPMASNKGQQMQNPQMGQNQPQGLMPMYPGMPPQGGMFGGMQPRSTFSDSASGQPYMGQVPMGSPMMQNGMGAMQMQTAQQMPPQAFDQMRQSNFLALQRPQGPYETPQPMPQMDGSMDPMGGMPMQTSQPYAMSGQPMGGGQQVPVGQGIQDLIRVQYAQNQMNGNQVPYGSAAGQIGMADMPQDLPGRGMPSGFRPSMGAIDGRALTNNLDITKRRQMNSLPGSIENTLPPSLKRPTQARMGLAGSSFGGRP